MVFFFFFTAPVRQDLTFWLVFFLLSGSCFLFVLQHIFLFLVWRMIFDCSNFYLLIVPVLCCGGTGNIGFPAFCLYCHGMYFLWFFCWTISVRYLFATYIPFGCFLRLSGVSLTLSGLLSASAFWRSALCRRLLIHGLSCCV